MSAPSTTLVRVRTHGPFFWRQQRLAALARRRSEAVSLGDYARLLRRYRRLLALCLALGLVSGVAAALLKPTVWVSGAVVYTRPIAIDPQAPTERGVRPRDAVSIDTEASIMLSYLVLSKAVARTSVTPGDLARHVNLTAAPNSRVIRIQVQDADPAQAQQLVDSLAKNYLAARTALLADRQAAQVAAVQAQIKVFETMGAETETALSDDTDDASSDVENPIDTQLDTLRGQLAGLQSADVDGGELLRAGSDPRRDSRQPQTQIISFALLGLVVGGLLIAVRERRPSTPRTASDIHRLPIAGDLPVALLDAGGPVDDGQGGWVAIADSIGPIPVVTLIVSLDGGQLDAALTTLTLSLSRRGYSVSPMGPADHETPADDGATARMLGVRASGRHLVGAGPAIDELAQSLSTTQTDGVVLMVSPGGVTDRELDDAIDRVVRLGITVAGVILDLTRDTGVSRVDRLTRAAS